MMPSPMVLLSTLSYDEAASASEFLSSSACGTHEAILCYCRLKHVIVQLCNCAIVLLSSESAIVQ
jgi:hypothetical protein